MSKSRPAGNIYCWPHHHGVSVNAPKRWYNRTVTGGLCVKCEAKVAAGLVSRDDPPMGSSSWKRSRDAAPRIDWDKRKAAKAKEAEARAKDVAVLFGRAR